MQHLFHFQLSPAQIFTEIHCYDTAATDCSAGFAVNRDNTKLLSRGCINILELVQF